MAEAATLITPYGGALVDLTVPEDARAELLDHAGRLKSLQLSERALCDLELLATGAFSPLDRFMDEADFKNLLHNMRLSNGAVFPIPISLPISADADIKLDSDLALRDTRNNILGIMSVEEIYRWDKAEFSRLVLGTEDIRHPLNAEMRAWGTLNVSGKIRVLSLPNHFDLRDLRLTPQQTRSRLAALGNANIVAFQTRNPLHRGHEELCRRAMRSINGPLLLHPVVGMTKPGDIDAYTRVRTYRSLIENYFDKRDSLLAVIPLAMRMAGPREAVWHMLIRRNFGADHFIVGRDHANPGLDAGGEPYYDPAAAQEAAMQFSDELGVKVFTSDELVYAPNTDQYEELSKIDNAVSYHVMSGSNVRERYLARGEDIPAWYMRPETAEILKQAHPRSERQGFCVWFTGLSGAGKSTIAEILTVLLNELGRNVTLLDGDVVRTHLSKGLGFSREDRDANVSRIGFVAAEIVRHNGVAICAAVSPYKATRSEVRAMFNPGHFIEVFVDTPLSICEGRDPKGVYAKARRGEVRNFTGIDDPYEAPENAEVILDTIETSAESNARRILDHLIERGFVGRDA